MVTSFQIDQWSTVSHQAHMYTTENTAFILSPRAAGAEVGGRIAST